MMQKAHTYLNLCFVITLFIITYTFADTPSKQNMSWLDNGQIRLGANLDIGGSITYLADTNTKENLINSFDWGRQVQMSFYSGPNPFIPEGKQLQEAWKGLGWNPIQSGDCFGHRSKIIEHTNDGTTLYVKCIPMHWPLNNVPGQCTFECWYTLDGRAVKVRSRLNNRRDDKIQYAGRDQELPAVYTNGPWHKLITYTGDKPFTADTLTEIPKKLPSAPFPWTYFYAIENWAALINENNTGLGIWQPGTYTFLGGFVGPAGTGGPKDSPTGYVSPILQEILDWNIQYDYNYVLIVDTLDNIRKYVYDNTAPAGPPSFTFKKNRQHWLYVNAVDDGLPIDDALTITPTTNEPMRLISPAFFCKACPEQKLIIVATVNTSENKKTVQGKLYWKTLKHDDFTWKPLKNEVLMEENSMTIELPADGTFHTTSINIGTAENYKGIITALRIEPFSSCTKGDNIKLKHIRIE